MTRRLPWQRDDAAPVRTPAKKNAANSTTSNRVATPQRAAAKTSATPDPRESSNRHPARSNGYLGERTPSTSPPPEPIRETFMREGLENDDKYRMVEDELFTVAGQFTAHLHAAEYQRLKAQTSSKNAETIKNIERPVVGSLTELARKRQEELLRKKKQREAIRQAKKKAGHNDESGDETTVPWRGTALQGLMDSPRKKEVPLMALTRMESGTKASSLFGGSVRSLIKRSPSPEETDDDSDDLDGPLRPSVARTVARAAPNTARPGSAKPALVTKRPSHLETLASMPRPAMPTSRAQREAARTASAAKDSATKVSPTNKTTKSAAGVRVNDDNDDDDDDEDLFARFKKRRMNDRQRPRPRPEIKDGRKAGSEEPRDIIPSFL